MRKVSPIGCLITQIYKDKEEYPTRLRDVLEIQGGLNRIKQESKFR